MELLDRYLQAVRFWLPKREKEDVVAELAEDIRSQMQEQEAQLGRALTDAELEVILRRWGHPLLVAERYLPQEHLIGPALFPVYRFVLKMVAFVYVVPWLLVWLGMVTFMPSYRAAHPGVALVQTLWGLVEAMVYVVVGITAAFAVLERVKDKVRFFENWDPRKLPAVRDPRQIRRFDSVFELAAAIVCSLWLTSLLTSSRNSIDLGGVQIVLNPAWRTFAWIALVVLVAAAVTSSINLFRPYWTPVRAAVRLVCDAAGAVAFGWLLNSRVVAAIVAPDVTPARAVWVTDQINHYLAKGAIFVIIIAAITVAVDLRRIARARSGASAASSGLATITALIALAAACAGTV